MSNNDPNELKNPHVDETVIVSRAELEAAAVEEALEESSETPNAITVPGSPGSDREMGNQFTKIPDTIPSTSSLGGKRELLLIIRGMIERVVMQEDTIVKLGRFEPATRQAYEVDLTSYGAMDRGVSRFHAWIHLQGEQLYITDNKSTNGTYLRHVKVVPNVATILRKGDELILGRLPIQVMFR